LHLSGTELESHLLNSLISIPSHSSGTVRCDFITCGKINYNFLFELISHLTASMTFNFSHCSRIKISSSHMCVCAKIARNETN
jgi:hypothetical protein